MTEPLPQLRPVRLQGKAYYKALRAILKDEGRDILATLATWRAEGHKVTPELLGAVAIKHTLNFKATCEFLEDSRAIPCGTYDRITDGGLRPTQCLRAGQEWLQARDGSNVTAMQAAFEAAR